MRVEQVGPEIAEHIAEVVEADESPTILFARDQDGRWWGLIGVVGNLVPVGCDVNGPLDRIYAAAMAAAEICPVCGQPDNCGDCDHTPVSP